MGLLFMFVAIVVEFAIAVLVIWQANKRLGKKGLLTAIPAIVALILLGYIWNCCTSWHSEVLYRRILRSEQKKRLENIVAFGFTCFHRPPINPIIECTPKNIRRILK